MTDSHANNIGDKTANHGVDIHLPGRGVLSRSGWRTKCVGPLLICLAAFLATLPQLLRGNSCGHDFDVHLVSWLDCLDAWRHGIVYPHWASSPNYAAGEPRFMFYPPLTWMLGAVLGGMVGWHLAPIVLTFLTFAGTGLATRALAREALDDAPATLAGCFAIFSGFALFTGYERTAFPEFAGGVFLPLLMLFALRETGAAPANSSSRTFDGSTVPLALALACCWLSNLPLGVIAGYLLAALALFAGMLRKSWVPVLRASVATLLGLGLAAIYWLPAALERNWVDIRQATQDPGYNYQNNWAFARHADPTLQLHDEILRQVSWIAVTMIAVSIVSIVIAWRRGTMPVQRSSANRFWFVPLAAIPVVVLVLLFPISGLLWHLPEMSFLQYPWRWLEAVEAPMAIFVVAAMWPATRQARVAVIAISVVAFLCATLYAGTQFFQVCFPEDSVAGTLASFHSGAGFEGMFEYAPPGADLTVIARNLPDACLVADPNTVLGKPDPDDAEANPIWSPLQQSCLTTLGFTKGSQSDSEHRALRGVVSQAGFLVLRLARYPAWQVRLNGRLVEHLPHRDDGLLAIPVSAGGVDLTIDWSTTRDNIAARWVSLVSVFLLLALVFMERGNGRARLT